VTANAELIVEVSGAIARVTLNRPDVRNAFNEQLIAELHRSFTHLDLDADVRVVVLAAQGKAFCAGADLHWMQRMAQYTLAENEADATRLADMLWAVHNCSKPVIARVQGDVFAGGLGLVAACDMAVAESQAHFCLSETRIGLVPATIAPYVAKAMGANAARRYALTAERFNAAEAHRIGLLHDVCEGEQALDETVGRIIDALLLCSPQAIAHTKRLLRDVTGQAITPALRAHTAHLIAEVRASDDGREGAQAFLGKRKPRWSSP
jgi:methylglutaconyl-CoA hydratase